MVECNMLQLATLVVFEHNRKARLLIISTPQLTHDRLEQW